MHFDFIKELFISVKKLNLTTMLDTNGTLPVNKLSKIVPYMDYAVVDLKSFNSKEHLKLTEHDNILVKESIKYLGAIDKLHQVRTVIVPEFLDNIANVNNTSKLIASINSNIQYNLIKYRNHSSGVNSFQALEPTVVFLNELKNLAIQNGLKNVIIT